MAVTIDEGESRSRRGNEGGQASRQQPAASTAENEVNEGETSNNRTQHECDD